jgi:rhomboid family GlyGly-CTERM serine protease
VAGRIRLTPPAWTLLAALLALGSLVAWWQPAHRWDWEPGLAFRQPWRWWTAAFVHWSAQHLVLNLVAAALVALLGRAAGCGPRAMLAWGVAWPLTHLALLVQPALAHYGGLSGVLHAGVAVIAWQLLTRPGLLTRSIGALLLAGLALKVGLEAPWRGALRSLPGWDILIAPMAHASGSVAGVVCAAVLVRR